MHFEMCRAWSQYSHYSRMGPVYFECLINEGRTTFYIYLFMWLKTYIHLAASINTILSAKVTVSSRISQIETRIIQNSKGLWDGRRTLR